MNSHFTKIRAIPATYRGLAVSVSAFFVISAAQVAGAQRVTGADVDTDVLSAILKAAASDPGPVDLRVDPRPLTADAANQYEIEPQALARVSADVIRRRTDVIRVAGLRAADTTIVNQSRKCPGALVIYPVDSAGRVDAKRVPGCPEDPFDVISVGPPRPGSAILPDDSVYDRNSETAARGYWAVRVIRKTLGHGGSSAYAADYVLAKRGGAWLVIKKVGLMYSE
jgi:hypothetical protein